MHIPRATYRIQFSAAMGFAAAREIVPYLADLGISDLYASPIFQARTGSPHGYDVVDPCRLNTELGREEDFRELCGELKSRGVYWLQDIVPNHMAIDSGNTLLMDVLENGEYSRYWRFFDIDWDHYVESMRGRMLIPVLGSFYAEALEKGLIRLVYDETGLHIVYYAFRLPLKVESYPGVFERAIDLLERTMGAQDVDFVKFIGAVNFFKTIGTHHDPMMRREEAGHARKMLWGLYSSNPVIREFINSNITAFNGAPGDAQSFNELDTLISEQRFKLSFWKVAAEEINYRRFFTINDLVSLRMEDEEVFSYTHEFLLRLIREGVIDGVRVDHIDGLRDPVVYLNRLRRQAPDTYIVVEKILQGAERMPPSCPVQGTTGYDALNYINGIFCRCDNDAEFSKLYYHFTGLHTAYGDLVCEKKRLIIATHLAGNIDNLAHLMKTLSGSDRYGRDITLYGLRAALSEVMANFPVYRTYISHGGSRPEDDDYIRQAIDAACRRQPVFTHEFAFIRKFLLRDFSGGMGEDVRNRWVDFVMSFQQYTAPLMAKGVEDTIFYIYNKLTSLNEVGAHPNAFGCTPDEFHAFNKARCGEAPLSLTATATHDTKRGEDVRCRINVLSEIPQEWEETLKLFGKLNRSRKKQGPDGVMPDENDEYFLYQSLLGAYPFEPCDRVEFRGRMAGFIIKAVREAKVHTEWIKPDSEYESACVSFVDGLLSDEPDNKFLSVFDPFQKKIAHYGILNSLSQVILKLTVPGIPDFYQGSEVWDLSLVDPDNRRPVDFQKRAALLSSVKFHGPVDSFLRELWRNSSDGRLKLFLIYKLLQARARNEELFGQGDYIPLEVHGSRKESVIAFCRRLGNSWVLSISARFFTSLVKEGELPLGETIWQDTCIVLPDEAPQGWEDVITGQQIQGGRPLAVGGVFSVFPGAVLIHAE